MRTDINLAIQLVAVAAIGVMRLATAGWIFVIFFIFLPIGTAALVVQVVLAVSAMRRGRLTPDISVGFLVLAGSGLGAAALMTDFTDGPRGDHSPLGLLTGHEFAQSWLIAMVLLLVWLVTAIGVAVRLAATYRPKPPAPSYAMQACVPLPQAR